MHCYDISKSTFGSLDEYERHIVTAHRAGTLAYPSTKVDIQKIEIDNALRKQIKFTNGKGQNTKHAEIELTPSTQEHTEWTESIRKASQTALNESANLPLPKIFTQIPKDTRPPVSKEVQDLIKRSPEDIEAAVNEEKLIYRKWKYEGGPAPSKSRFSGDVEPNPRSNIYRSQEGSDRWNCYDYNARGDRWHMLDHQCNGDTNDQGNRS